MAVMRLHHLGIATDELDALVERYGELLGLEVAHRERFDGMEIAFLALDAGYLELLEPVGNDGPIRRFLDRSGPGIHHVAFEVADLPATVEGLADRGVDVLEEPRLGAWGHQVVFVHPRDMGGVLVEFVEV